MYTATEPCLCGARKGQLHELGCQYEECPFCREQLYFCSCPYKLLGIREEVDELDDEQDERWRIMLEEKGRVPEGQEVGRKAGVWTSEERRRVAVLICGQMRKAASRGASSSQRLVEWSSRIEALLTKPHIWLEMNRRHILRGGPIEWEPPE